jgi:hypothetical protein
MVLVCRYWGVSVVMRLWVLLFWWLLWCRIPVTAHSEMHGEGEQPATPPLQDPRLSCAHARG